MINNTSYKNNNIAFGSRIKSTDTLKRLFHDVKSEEYPPLGRYKIVRSLNSILNDGKNDIIELGKDVQRSENIFGSPIMVPTIIAKVNGKNVVAHHIPQDCSYLGESNINYKVLTTLAQKRNPKLNSNSLLPEIKNLIDLTIANKEAQPELLNEINRLVRTMCEKLGQEAIDDVCKLAGRLGFLELPPKKRTGVVSP